MIVLLSTDSDGSRQIQMVVDFLCVDTTDNSIGARNLWQLDVRWRLHIEGKSVEEARQEMEPFPSLSSNS